MIPDPISDTERLSRYITDEENFRPLRPPADQIYFRAFLPSRKLPEELSILRTDGLSETDVWELGGRAVAEPSGRQIFGRGDFVATVVRRIKLDVKPDEPPARHAVVFGWPPLAETEARKSLAQQLSADATPIPRP